MAHEKQTTNESIIGSVLMDEQKEEQREKLILKDEKGRFLPGCNPNPAGRNTSARQKLWDNVFTPEVKKQVLTQLRDQALAGDRDALEFVASRISIAKPKSELEESKLSLETEVLQKAVIDFDKKIAGLKVSITCLERLLNVVRSDDKYKAVVASIIQSLAQHS
ncbi:MAG: hypothetical protein A2X77_04410 [Gammaproteobacteria bacterium GWE2_42_36]|nr:MAG: hypothetical protein A2X77_04410 [Gammaproteobacteria bacterium GWE2_42_36]